MQALHVGPHADEAPSNRWGLAHTESLLAAKYRIDMLFFKPLRALQAAFGRGHGRPIALAITPKS